ncbi:MAG: TonB-dependent receptor [Verrucomicrobiota bacterium JB022]|nr:TonB-dependent receptor [Verrucomicrobiota bacterium JB022]
MTDPASSRRAWLRFARASTLSLALLGALPLSAQDAVSTAGTPPEDEIFELEAFEISGLRQSLYSAQYRKRESIEFVDAIVADDIGKLPDTNVTEALQRVTGIQITRDRGEGSSVTIRGLSQVQTTMNGREAFTAGGGRGLDFQDMPSELVSAIEVFKTPSANMIEGGLGGTVNIITHKPFDFEDFTASATVKGHYGEMIDEISPQVTGLVSDRWKVGKGEMGALINYSYQEREYRSDLMDPGNPTPRTDLIDGETVYISNGVFEPVTGGKRTRKGLHAALQWRPNDELEFYGEYSFTDFTTQEQTHGLSMALSDQPVAGSVELFPGTQDVRRASFENTGFTVLSFLRPTKSESSQFAVGGSWRHDRWTIKGDLSYTEAVSQLIFNGVFLNGQVDQYTMDVGGDVASTMVTGTDLLDPSIYQVRTLSYTQQNHRGDQIAGSLDATYEIGSGFWDSVEFGARYAARRADNRDGTLSRNQDIALPGADNTSLLREHPWGDFFPDDRDIPMLRNYVVADLSKVQGGYRNWDQFGVSNAAPNLRPLSVWEMQEDTTAGYAMLNYRKDSGLKFDGNIGARVVGTSHKVSGFRPIPETGESVPLDRSTDYVDFLPSLNARLHLADDLFLRMAASKTITRPRFSQLSPSLTLLRNTTNPAQNQGSAGNPELDPMRSDSLDISLEKYFSGTTSVYLAGFYKEVEGFPTSVVATETHEGEQYQISRPQNMGKATIKGIEVGYQQFFDFLPGWLSGFGIQANYTYVDSESDSSVTGLTTPLDSLSEHSYNIVGMYENDKFSARIAYNWRDSFFSGTQNIVGLERPVPIYWESYGWLDASVSYDVTENATLSLQGTNLLNTMREAYFGQETRRHQYTIDDVQVIMALTIRI